MAARGAGRVALPPLAAGAAVLAGLAGASMFDPGATTLVPCPLFEVTGLACPFCGGIRAAYALVHGDIAAAAGHNLALLAVVPVAAVLWVRWVARRARGAHARFAVVPTRTTLVAGLVLVAFAVVRNLPAGAWLAPHGGG